VVAADTAIGAVHGDEGYFHCGLRRHRVGTRFEEVWWLIQEGRLPSADELAQFRRSLAEQRRVPQGLKPLIEVVAAMDAPPLAKLRAVLSASSQVLNLAPVIDLDDDGRREQSLRLAAIVAPVLAALAAGSGQPPVRPDPSLDTLRPTCTKPRAW
jgi:citrate synthase